MVRSSSHCQLDLRALPRNPDLRVLAAFTLQLLLFSFLLCKEVEKYWASIWKKCFCVGWFARAPTGLFPAMCWWIYTSGCPHASTPVSPFLLFPNLTWLGSTATTPQNWQLNSLLQGIANQQRKLPIQCLDRCTALIPGLAWESSRMGLKKEKIHALCF